MENRKLSMSAMLAIAGCSAKVRYDEVSNHLEANDRTLSDEYELVMQKKSTLSARLRKQVIDRFISSKVIEGG